LAHIATQLLEHIEGPYSLEFLVPVIRLLSQCISPDVLKTVSLESKDALAAFLGIYKKTNLGYICDLLFTLSAAHVSEGNYALAENEATLVASLRAQVH
jgi:hypothetical protein